MRGKIHFDGFVFDAVDVVQAALDLGTDVYLGHPACAVGGRPESDNFDHLVTYDTKRITCKLCLRSWKLWSVVDRN